ncbi:MAG: class I SAM-dependent methyltransferase [Proteobacteria bacterium]|nr:class I SAM-dependent methyltransferase [Pseudomonadota bacterium]MBU1742736.1 class I SAM-dependent methyltransferase [Pseudomonadota bacterium]
MFSYVFMKILEMRPGSYDARMDRVSKGRVRAVKEAVAGEILAGGHVLEIGCGTGELAAMMIQRGATVDGFDLSPAMLAVAGKRIEDEGLGGRFSVRPLGVDGMDRLPDRAYDAVVATLVLSELSDDERRFAIKHAARVLKPGGRLVVADEVAARSMSRRLFQALIRLPLMALTYLVSRALTRPLRNLTNEVAAAGLVVAKEARSHGDAFALVVARRPGEETD